MTGNKDAFGCPLAKLYAISNLDGLRWISPLLLLPSAVCDDADDVDAEDDSCMLDFTRIVFRRGDGRGLFLLEKIDSEEIGRKYRCGS